MVTAHDRWWDIWAPESPGKAIVKNKAVNPAVTR